MGAWLKLGAILTTLAVSYALNSLVLLAASTAVGILNLSKAASTTCATLAGDLLASMSAITVLSFFTIPAILAAFGHGGAWVKHVLARFGKGLLAAFGTSLLFYIGAAAASSVEIGASIASVGAAMPVLGVVALLALAVLSRDALLKAAEVVLSSAFSPTAGRFLGMTRACICGTVVRRIGLG